jgi:hypothetical protein
LIAVNVALLSVNGYNVYRKLKYASLSLRLQAIDRLSKQPSLTLVFFSLLLACALPHSRYDKEVQEHGQAQA